MLNGTLSCLVGLGSRGLRFNVSLAVSSREPTVQSHHSMQLNAQYGLCMSYPAVLAGPASLQEASPESVRIIRGSAAFRSEKRLPALTWSCGVDGASLR